MSDVAKIKSIRGAMGVGILIAKEALDKANGDVDGAIKVLCIAGAGKAEKRAGKDTSEGIVFSYIHHNEQLAKISK